jgi:hypothetical protein
LKAAALAAALFGTGLLAPEWGHASVQPITRLTHDQGQTLVHDPSAVTAAPVIRLHEVVIRAITPRLATPSHQDQDRDRDREWTCSVRPLAAGPRMGGADDTRAVALPIVRECGWVTP